MHMYAYIVYAVYVIMLLVIILYFLLSLFIIFTGKNPHLTEVLATFRSTLPEPWLFFLFINSISNYILINLVKVLTNEVIHNPYNIEADEFPSSGEEDSIPDEPKETVKPRDVDPRLYQCSDNKSAVGLFNLYLK